MATEAPASYIDTLLKRVSARGGTLGIRFETGAPVRVTDGNGGIRDVTNRTLSTQEIMAAIMPMIPETIKRLPQQPSVAFNYDCDGVGPFNVVIRREGEQLWVSIDPGPTRAAAALRHATSSAAGSRTAEGRTGTHHRNHVGQCDRRREPRLVERPRHLSGRHGRRNRDGRRKGVHAAGCRAGSCEGRRTAIDRLFHLMVERRRPTSTSRVGMPPLVRKDGEHPAAREGAPALDRRR